ncbi:hypothetical protein D9M72_446800 [compost metagenome]
MQEALLRGGRRKGQAEIDDVGCLRAGIALVRPDCFQLIGRTGIGVQLVDLDARIFRLEAGDHFSVVAPVVGQRDDCQRAFLGGSCHEFLRSLGAGDTRQRRGQGKGGDEGAARCAR